MKIVEMNVNYQDSRLTNYDTFHNLEVIIELKINDETKYIVLQNGQTYQHFDVASPSNDLEVYEDHTTDDLDLESPEIVAIIDFVTDTAYTLIDELEAINDMDEFEKIAREDLSARHQLKNLPYGLTPCEKLYI